VAVAVVLPTISARPADATKVPDKPVASGTLSFDGSLTDGSVLSVSGVSWTPAPCTSSGVCSTSLNVFYSWHACSGTSCQGVKPAVVQPLLADYQLGPAEVGKRIKVTEKAVDIRSDGSTETSSLSATTLGTVAPWPAGTPPRVDLIDGTPESTTASDQEEFVLSPAHANPSDGPVSITCSLDGSPPSDKCEKALKYTTPILSPGPHTFTVTATNDAGSTPTSFSWTVVPLPGPVPCPSCFHPPSVASNGQPMTWDWQLSNANSGLVLRDVDMIDIDGFDNSAATVTEIHARSGPTLSSEKAICYLDLGAWEEYRPDAGSFSPAVVGKAMSGWPQEYWVDVRQLSSLEPIINSRLQMCADKGFDGVEVDDIDGYTQASQTGFPLTAGDAQNWLAYVANEAHSLGMFVLWKNDPYLASWAVPYFDGAISEQCYQYTECTPQQNAGANGCNLTSHPCGVSAFTTAGKWVGEVEYSGVCDPTQSCSGKRSFATYCQTVWSEPPTGYGFAAFKADLNLDGDDWFPCW
jgi:hypothetical protein